MVHSRFSTNTFPSWSRAHPYRYISHNGEINTLRGNVNWMRAREATLRSEAFGADLARVLPVVDGDGSDSAMFDNVLELLHLAGRSLPHAVMMMIPEPWGRHATMSQARRDFYAYHAALMEPWDGPASIAFTDGTVVGATLDRNGLRPARYWVTADGRVVMASETGVLDIAPPPTSSPRAAWSPAGCSSSTRPPAGSSPTTSSRSALAAEQPYGEWIGRSMIRLPDLPAPRPAIEPDHATVLRRQEAFGYTTEEIRMVVAPMAVDGAEPIGSMGDDAPLAVLSDQPRLLPDYFTQLFAQVTNPPLDAIREEIVTAVETVIGPGGEPPGARSRRGPPARPAEPGAAQRGAGAAARARRRRGRARLPERDPADRLPGRPTAGPACGGRSRPSASTPARRSPRAATSSSCPTGATTRSTPRSRPSSPWRPSTTTSCGPGRGPASGSCWSPASRARSTTSATLIGYGASAVNPYLAFETIDDLVRGGDDRRAGRGRRAAVTSRRSRRAS